MKRILIFAVMMILAAGVAYAKNYEVTKKVGGYEVTVTLDKNPPVAGGDNNVTVIVKDAAGKAVTDAKVLVDYSMPAMPGMPAMNYKTTTTLDGSLYKAKMNFSMSGSWSVAVKVRHGGKMSTVKFSVDVQ
ncbi:MAG: FixH family protein [Nitrospiraceae bacterium]|nr:FixH family protein [Nitrospiraceae bacterium]